MKDALTHTKAASAARGGRLARLVRHGLLACLLAGIGAGAVAQNHDRGGRRDEAQQGRFQVQGQEPRFDQRAYDMQMREEQRRQIQMQQEQQRNEAARRSGRMTPDERRDLRRQINEAGMDLYPNAQRR
ncbi:hypothetical protein [Massilia niastensis]|uniref:hypothetical protein n=1 Tax=Massilia niastensis TaxID=544911 RepID=UPI00037F18FE|nr:hypothetical protein [Massilia niastensis]